MKPTGVILFSALSLFIGAEAHSATVAKIVSTPGCGPETPCVVLNGDGKSPSGVVRSTQIKLPAAVGTVFVSMQGNYTCKGPLNSTIKLDLNLSSKANDYATPFGTSEGSISRTLYTQDSSGNFEHQHVHLTRTFSVSSQTLPLFVTYKLSAKTNASCKLYGFSATGIYTK